MLRRPTGTFTRLVSSSLVGLVYTGAVFADNVSGSDSLLCYGLSAARCEVGEACEIVEPWQLDMPDFVKLDVRGKRLQTTAGSAVQRETELQSVQRANGAILIHGTQGERVFSWLVNEVTGEGTLSIAAHGQSVTVFTVCTAADKL
jgi:hypothetical protein